MSVILGPLPPSDTRFMRRVRVHQAWYRACVLGLSKFGNLADSGVPCGSVLPDDAARAFLNFHGSTAIYRFLDRRTKGWGVDPVRCTKYLTSSQTLSFNMLAHALAHPRRCADLFNALLVRKDLKWLESSDFEFASQGSIYSLGDKTLLDVLLRFKTNGGGTQVVAVETKLADRFSTRRTSAMTGDNYRNLAVRSGTWHSLGSALASNRTRQLARCHALAESVQSIDDVAIEHATLLVLTHPDDEAASRAVTAYTSLVANGTIVHRSWSEFLATADAVCAVSRSVTDELSRRYVDLTWSAAAWSDLEQKTPLASTTHGAGAYGTE